MQSHPIRLRNEQPIEKAARLVRQQRITLSATAQVYDVIGDSANYRVIADEDGIYCPCKASTPLCAHVLAAAHLREKEKARSGPEFSVRVGVR